VQDQEPQVAGLVLAAGRSSRFGAPKQLALLAGRPLLDHVLALGIEAGLRPLVAVVPPWLSPTAVRPRPASLRWVANPHPELGVRHSLALGLAALGEAPGPLPEAVVILLADQPTLSPDAIRRVISGRGPRPVVAAFAEGRLGHPVLIERSHWRLVEQIRDEGGLGPMLTHRPDLVTAVEFPGHPLDVDRPEDLGALEDA
jgi:CTP:molybdopterin cytidylyltransferase MocA